NRAAVGFQKGRISVHNFQLGSDAQSIVVEGALGTSGSESLTVAVRNLRLASLGPLLPARGLPKGVVDLNCTLSHSLARPEISGDLTATDLKFDTVKIGSVKARLTFRDSTLAWHADAQSPSGRTIFSEGTVPLRFHSADGSTAIDSSRPM